MRRRLWAAEEDAILKRLAGVKPAAEIAEILGRPKNGIHHRIKALGLDGRMSGEHHWNCKHGNLLAAMLHSLHDAGFKPAEIHNTMSRYGLNFDQVKALLYSGTRK